MNMTISQKVARDIPIRARVYRLVTLANGKQRSRLVRAAIPDEVALGNEAPGQLLPLPGWPATHRSTERKP